MWVCELNGGGEMKDLVGTLLPFILEGGIVAVGTFLLTMSQVRRGARLENDGKAIENGGSIIDNLKSIIEVMRTDSETRKQEMESVKGDLDRERMEKTDLIEENTAIKMMMCIHMGCILRTPMMGQGDNWFNTHRDDPSLGCDYLPINQLMIKYGKVKKENNGQS